MKEGLQQAENSPQVLDADEILDTALKMAGEEANWYDLSLVELAKRCNAPVNDVRRYYPDTNAIANAWFARALDAMLAPQAENVENLSTRDLLDFIIWRWFEALEPYHQVTTQMLGAKLHLPHIHHWVPMVFELSRLVQLWRDAAGLHTGGRRRQIEETVLTGIFLATLREWCRDDSPQHTDTHSRLLRRLSRAERAAEFWFLSRAS